MLKLGLIPCPAALKLGFVYFLGVFGLGFVLGGLRVLLLVPTLGELAAVSLEIPVMLGFSWWFCRKLLARRSCVQNLSSRFFMGFFAFLLLLAAELGLAKLAFGRPFSEQWRAFQTAPGVVGVLGQILFGMMPIFNSSTDTPS